MRTPQVVALGGSLLRPEELENRKMWLGKLRQLAVHIEGNSRKLGIFGNLERGFWSASFWDDGVDTAAQSPKNTFECSRQRI